MKKDKAVRYDLIDVIRVGDEPELPENDPDLADKKHMDMMKAIYANLWCVSLILLG